ncbi:hypothetical protein PSHT_00998 [Puccinia striiformis]|uniref:Uncharacterized protein n=1 Tax=Puccinia striiformis TaxID=27350 RepID=A0A2S4WLR6_9BASI|nr:hypothetical protein PSHT_00998 [Puccinia striiformis]
MPKIRTNRTKPPPEGFEDIEGLSRDLFDWLLDQDYADASKSLSSSDHKNGLDLTLFFLIAKWKRTGFEGLCCARCVQSRDMNYAGSVCICRVPKANLKPGTVVECVHCGCRGCASGD